MAIHDGGVTEKTVGFHEKDLEKAVTWRVLLDLLLPSLIFCVTLPS